MEKSNELKEKQKNIHIYQWLHSIRKYKKNPVTMSDNLKFWWAEEVLGDMGMSPKAVG